jgi:hypothetical protein
MRDPLGLERVVVYRKAGPIALMQMIELQCA